MQDVKDCTLGAEINLPIIKSSRMLHLAPHYQAWLSPGLVDPPYKAVSNSESRLLESTMLCDMLCDIVYLSSI